MNLPTILLCSLLLADATAAARTPGQTSGRNLTRTVGQTAARISDKAAARTVGQTTGQTSAKAAERPIVVQRDFGKLFGTLLTPGPDAETGKTAGTVALIIAGSGPTDRNGNNSLGSGGDTYRLLAEALADEGIATLRYDKRAIAQSVLDDPTRIPDLTLDDYIADAAALADYLAAEGFRRVVLIGHSEGALIALCAAQQSQTVRAVVSLCGAGYPLDEIVRLQLAGQLAMTHPQLLIEAEGIIAALKRGEKVDMTYRSRELYALFNPGVQTFLISSLRYDPRQEIRRLQCPVLLVGGDNDLQITPDNTEALAKARPDAEKVILPGMTHMLKHSDEHTLAGQVKTVYSDPSLPLDPALVRLLAAFIARTEPDRTEPMRSGRR